MSNGAPCGLLAGFLIRHKGDWMNVPLQCVIGRVLLFVTCAFLLLGCSTVPAKPDHTPLGDYTYTKEYISWLVENELDKNDVPGLSIALVDDQRIAWAEGFGYADKKNRIPATPETVYGVGSISKLFTITAAMQLAEQGTMDIDKPLQAYLPEFSIKSRFGGDRTITPRSIMTHHSGLPFNLLRGMWVREPEPFTSVVGQIKDDYVAYPPNFIFSYSNLGITLLGHAIERVSHRDFVSYMDDSLFRLMNMTRSSFSPVPALKGFLAKGYLRDEETEDLPIRDIPAAALQSNVLDLSKFLQMIFAQGRYGEHRILKPETLAEMLRPQNENVPLDLDFRVGLGWMLSAYGDNEIRNAGLVAYHVGTTPLFEGRLVILPVHKLGVVVLANSSSARGLVDRVATETLKQALEAKTGIMQPSLTRPAEDESSRTISELEACTGWYATNVGLVKVTRKSDSLQALIMKKTITLVPHSDGQFGLKYKLLGLIPISLGQFDTVGISLASVETIAGRQVVKARFGNQEIVIGEKIKPVPIPEKWLKREGTYEFINPDSSLLPDEIKLFVEEGLLVVECSVPFWHVTVIRFALMPVSDSEAIIAGLGRNMGETIRVVTVDGREMLYYSGYLLRMKT